jgi:hypothetical protein
VVQGERFADLVASLAQLSPQAVNVAAAAVPA